MATSINNAIPKIPVDASSWKHVPVTSDIPAYDIFLKAIEKPSLDTREYRLIRLENGLEALLIHDKDADTSAAAMDIAVGHLADPDDMPGLAHFCEHMLFLGTKQFPKENGYNEYISAHGGHTNAYTAPSSTNYYFCVSSTSTPQSSERGTPRNQTPNPDSNSTDVTSTLNAIKKTRAPLPTALKMFASFFHSPLFTPTGTARELNAVDSEHKKNSQSDRWRIFQLSKGLSRDITMAPENGEGGIVKKHPWAKFGSGNKNTLSAFGRAVAATRTNGNGEINGHVNKTGRLVVDPANPLSPLPSESEPDGGPVGVETRRRLVEWWEKEYCAGRMKLTILGRESLDELTQLTANLFSPILNRGQDPAPAITIPPLGEKELGTLVQIKTVMDFRALDITFCIPWQAHYYLNKPANFIGHFVGHEGPGSIHSYLKSKGWITAVSAGPSSLGRGFSRFGVYLQLTKEGMDNYKSVLKAVYKYLDVLRAACGLSSSTSSNAGSSSFNRYHESEIRALADIHFRFSEKVRAESYVSDVAGAMNRPYAREHILSGGERIWDWDEQAVKDVLNLLRPDNSRVLFLGKDFSEALVSDETGEWKRDKWYTTEYRILKLDTDVLRCTTPGVGDSENIPELYLPEPNDFIPSALNVEKIEIAEPSKAPVKIESSPLSTLWFKKDDQFWVPKASFSAYVITPMANTTPRLAVSSRLYTELVNDALTEYSYNASLAGLGYNFSSYDRGIFFGASGYNEKIPVLSQKVLETMKNLKMDPERFKVIKEDLKEEWENFYLLEPYRIADYWNEYLVAETIWTPKERLVELEDITVNDIDAHKQLLLSRAHIEALIHGNLAENEAKSLLKSTEKVLGSRPITNAERQTERSLVLPEGSNFIYKSEVPNPKEVNSCLVYTCYVGRIVDRNLSALNGLLLHMMREPAFDELRTKQQLGYVVFVIRHESRGMLGTKVIIQSERSPEYLESRVDKFLTQYRAQLEKISPEEFQRQKEGLISAKLERLDNLNAECNRFWSRIVTGYCDFTRRMLIIPLIDSVTLLDEDEVEVLQRTTLEDLLGFFDTYVNPASLQRRKLSIHLSSQVITSPDKSEGAPPPPLRFSIPASEEFLTLLKTHNIPIEDEAQYRALSQAEPPVMAVKAFWTDFLGKRPDSEVPQETRELLLNSIDELTKKHPKKGEQDTESDEVVKIGVEPVLVKDIAAFKAGLPLGPAAVPVSDLFLTQTN
ncbi:hypothetical protein Clacol_006621 [Clathrus columnatus]|uniref:Insulin-degrading enzyme n=1 Tax=Clathrus columnatus TaxID=1419009 RepID=A0AAV5AHM1_9AGAM|nr:hypothetical protein Clacol_006621 [Clathrus columnatus]